MAAQVNSRTQTFTGSCEDGLPTVTGLPQATNGVSHTITGECEIGTMTFSGDILSLSLVFCDSNTGSYTANITLTAGDGPKVVTVCGPDLTGNFGSGSASTILDTVDPALTATATCTSASYSVDITLTAVTGSKTVTLQTGDSAGNTISVELTTTLTGGSSLATPVISSPMA